MLHPDSPYKEVLAAIQAHIRTYRDTVDGPLDVLEAGCGSASMFDFGDDVRCVGIDISRKQLDRHTGLVEAIEADLCTYILPAARFDIVVCWNVLEHLSRPEHALDQFRRTIKPGGLLILGLPNVLSLHGLVARWTPHRFHIWFVRHVMGKPWAGTDDHGPFRTYLRLSVSPPALRRFAATHGLVIKLAHLYVGPQIARLARRSRLVRWSFRSLNTIAFLTAGRLQPRLAASAFVFAKPLQAEMQDLAQPDGT